MLGLAKKLELKSMKVKNVIGVIVIGLIMTSCGMSNDFARKKYLRIGMLAPVKTETNIETNNLLSTEHNASREKVVFADAQFNLSKEDSVSLEASSSINEESKSDVVVENLEVQVANEVVLTDEKLPVIEIEPPTTKLKSNKFIGKTYFNSQPSLGRTILVTLAVIILLPLVLIGLMVLYLYFFPAW
jgi:hypothetical protein